MTEWIVAAERNSGTTANIRRAKADPSPPFAKRDRVRDDNALAYRIRMGSRQGRDRFCVSGDKHKAKREDAGLKPGATGKAYKGEKRAR